MTVDYIPFANLPGANVEAQNQWITDNAPGGSLAVGFVQGLAQSQQGNKVLRQTSMMSAALANYIAATLGLDVLDDGNIAALITKLTNAINASALVQAQFVASQIAGPPMTVRDATGFNATSAPNTSFTLNALQVILRSATGSTVSVFEPTPLTVDITATGPVANGRDQLSIFPNNTTIHVYFIWGAVPGLATVCSLSGPSDSNPTGLWTVNSSQFGPTMPSTYTHAAYATSVVLDSATHIRPCTLCGSRLEYRDDQVLFNGATSPSLTAVALDAVVPRLANRVGYGGTVTVTNPQANAAVSAFLSQVNAGAGQRLAQMGPAVGVGSAVVAGALEVNYQGSGNVYHYESTVGVASPQILLTCRGYTVPNGG